MNSPQSVRTAKPATKPFRSTIGRTPQIKLHGNIVASPFESAETVIVASKFKATCLQLLDAGEQGETITVCPDFKAWEVNTPRKTRYE